MEKQIFDWKDWEGDVTCMQFYDCTLKVPIGKFPVGTKIPSIAISYEISEMIMFVNKEDRDGIQFRLLVSVGEQIKGG